MITKQMVKDAYDKGVIELDVSPNGDGIVAKIDEGWFYFGGLTAEEYTDPREYEHDIPKETIVDDIYETLDGFGEWEELCDEYGYYEEVFKERGINDYE